MAIIVGISVYIYANSLQEKMQNTVIPTGQVVVAVINIPANTKITSDMVAVVEMPEEAVNPIAAKTLSSVVGYITQYPLAPEEQVLSIRLKKQGDNGGGGLSYVVEEGQRAISVGVDTVTGISGFLSKGDHVDVVATVLQTVNDKSVPVSTMLVEDLLVLETGEKQLSSTESTASSYTTVTLSATPEQILKINYAVNNGKIMLVLRSVLDKDILNPDSYSPNASSAALDSTAGVTGSTDAAGSSASAASSESVTNPAAADPSISAAQTP